MALARLTLTAPADEVEALALSWRRMAPGRSHFWPLSEDPVFDDRGLWAEASYPALDLTYTIELRLRLVFCLYRMYFMETSTQFSFRAPAPFIAETEAAARLAGLSRSEYARRAIEEMNRRVMAERIAALSKQLAVLSSAEGEALDDATADGLNG